MSSKRSVTANQNVTNSAIPLPDPPDPQKWICVQMMIPDSLGHRAAFLGAISNLGTWRVWQRDTNHGGSIVADLWKKARRSIQFVECSIPPHMGVLVEVPNTMSDLVQVVCIDGKCVLQYRCDVCSPWQTVANVSDLNTNPSGSGNQPAPGGGTASDCVTIYCNQAYAIPIPVNTGDKIEITSATGKWSDQFARWLCIDGNLFFIDCTGVGGAPGGGSDFLPSANHLSAIVRFSTGYYPLYPGGSLIVPGGVVNEQPTILANKPTVASGDGWIDICWKVTNNSVVNWCHNLDFAISPYGFQDWSSAGGPVTWVPSVGWQHAGGGGQNCQIKHIAGSAYTITRLKYTANTDAVSPAPSSAVEAFFGLATPYPGTNIAPLVSGDNSADSTGTPNNTTLGISIEDGSATTLTIKSCTVYGQGPDPFAGDPTC